MIYAILQYGCLTIICLYLVNYFASREVSNHVRIWSVITWVANFGLALLVPEDVFQTLNGKVDQHASSQLGFQYLLLYWSVYLLTWTVIPVLQQWEDAGDLESKDRLKRSLRTNGIFYVVLLALAVVSLVFILWLGLAEEMGLIMFLKCLATMWGMLLLMVLLGYSLVQIPRTMWRNAHPSQYLPYLYQRIFEMQQEVQTARRQFKQIAAYVGHVKKNTNDPEILRYCQNSQDMIPVNLKSIVKSTFQKVITSTGYMKTYPISLQSSIEHNRLMKRGISRVRRQERGLHDYVMQAIFYQDIKEAIETGCNLRSYAKETNKFQSFWYCKLRPVGDKILALFIAFCCLILLISQTQVFLSRDTSLLGYLLKVKDIQIIRILVFFVMGFVIYMSNYALFRLKLANLYGLYKKESDGASLMFATVNFSRIGVAIVLNFFDMIKMKNSVYSHFMQTPQMGLLGQWVFKGLPGILWLIVLCHYCNFWGWLAKKFGMQSSLSFLSHQLSKQQLSLQSPILVVNKRGELNQRGSAMFFRESGYNF